VMIADDANDGPGHAHSPSLAPDLAPFMANATI
jgi:hypothetical protein